MFWFHILKLGHSSIRETPSAVKVKVAGPAVPTSNTFRPGKWIVYFATEIVYESI
jgi:hypothetical protein